MQLETTWIDIPAGTADIGLTDQEHEGFLRLAIPLGLNPERIIDEIPGYSAEINAFKFMQAPLTNKQYAAFVSAQSYQNLNLFAELLHDFGPQTRALIEQFTDQHDQPGPLSWQHGTYVQGQENHPVHGISFYEACACARFYETRLPTEEEWEYAVRYPDKRHFPWGNEISDKNIAHFKWNNATDTCQIGQYPKGTSNLGLIDVAGNVHEWTSSFYQAYPNGVIRNRFLGTERGRCLRGGSFDSELWDLRTTSRFGLEPQHRFYGLGVRFARNG